MIFGVDAQVTLDNKYLQSCHHGFTGYSELGVRSGSSNIRRAMYTDPIWGCHTPQYREQHIRDIQAIQDKFPLIGHAAERIAKEQEDLSIASLPQTR